MNSNRATGLKLGLRYLMMGLPGWFNLMYVPGAIIVRGDATATAHNLAAGELTWRFGILAGLVSSIGFLFLALSLYNLFKDVDRTQARLLMVMVSAAVAIGLANLLNQAAPLVLLSGADLLSVFTKPQLDALAMGFLRLRTHGDHLAMAFWGLWLFPFGVLVMKSGFFPRVLGVLLVIGCFAYLTVSFTWFVLPAYRNLVNQVALPFYGVGEASMLIWLFVKGVNVRPREAQPVGESLEAQPVHVS